VTSVGQSTNGFPLPKYRSALVKLTVPDGVWRRIQQWPWAPAAP
jgi:hypothetical protein